ncbi:hypothetical protein AB0F71_25515 [Kitasatospora sp. NPDC028055]|uniref:hypothetical protein n=1 Tax=Kitasatospora sp. NPDC028055 TaxID=3155653 RepID=UPI0033F1F327
MEPNSEGWRREGERKAFDEVPSAINQPNLPQDGMLDVEYSPLVESAHRAGRALHTLGNADLTAAVLAETSTELTAVENAQLGDLTGRARQAVLLNREGASPVQVAAADRLLQQDPFGPAALFTEIDPTAAAVAAHWLAASAQVAAAASGHSATSVLLEAGASPYDAVTGLVRHALHIADGLLPDPASLREQLEGIDDAFAQHTGPDTDPEDTGLRLTPLDPQRPAPDLLEDLLAGIPAAGSSTRNTAHSTTMERIGMTSTPKRTRTAAAATSPSSSAKSPPPATTGSSDHLPDRRPATATHLPRRSVTPCMRSCGGRGSTATPGCWPLRPPLRDPRTGLRRSPGPRECPALGANLAPGRIGVSAVSCAVGALRAPLLGATSRLPDGHSCGGSYVREGRV